MTPPPPSCALPQVAKGDVLTVAQLAGVMGAKHTATLIPLCHNIPLSRVHVELRLAPEAHAVEVEATGACARNPTPIHPTPFTPRPHPRPHAPAATTGQTGVEMEALTAAAVAALTVYDMCKAASKALVVTDLRLLAKSGGRSGEYRSGDVQRGGGGGAA